MVSVLLDRQKVYLDDCGGRVISIYHVHAASVGPIRVRRAARQAEREAAESAGRARREAFAPRRQERREGVAMEAGEVDPGEFSRQ